jgi:hypothetical protein
MKVSAAAQKLGPSMQICTRWVVRAREGKLATADAHRVLSVSELQIAISGFFSDQLCFAVRRASRGHLSICST